MAKKVKAVVKVQIQAGKATAAPPVGTALGPHGINMGQFIKEYNEKTAPLTGTVVPAVVTIFEDRSYTRPGPPDRRDEDGRPEREHDRFGHANGRRHGS